MEEYKKYEFCKRHGCNEWKKPKQERLCKTECSFSAWSLHDYLQMAGYKIVKDA